MSLSLSPDLFDGEGLLDGSASVVDELAHVEEHLCTVQRLSANAHNHWCSWHDAQKALRVLAVR